MKQATAIRRAYALRGDYDRVYRRGEWWRAETATGDHITLCHVSEMRTVDHNGHSTRVYCRHHYVGTVFGTVTTV